MESELPPVTDAEDPELMAGREIQRLRKARGWSQEEVARRMKAYGYDFNQALISRIELGQRPLRVNELAKFAELFGVTVPHLLFEHISLEAAEAEIAKLEPELKAAEARAAEAEAALKAVEGLNYELNRIHARLDYLRQRRDSLKPANDGDA